MQVTPQRKLLGELHTLVVIVGAFLGGIGGFEVAALWSQNPQVCVPVGAAAVGLVLIIVRSEDDPPTCPECGKSFT